MRTLGWIQKRFFRQNNNAQSKDVSARKSYSCFSALWEINEQQHYPEAIINSAHFKHPEHGVNEEDQVEMSTDFFHRFLAIGTLGSVLITKEPVPPTTAMIPEIASEKESGAAENELQYQNNKSENLGEKDTKESLNTVVKEYSGTTVTKEKTREQKSTPNDSLFKRYATSYKRSGKLDKRVKMGTQASQFMKKMLKKLDFTSCRSPTSVGDNAIVSDSTAKKPNKVFRKSRKIHPQAANLHVIKSHSYEVMMIGYEKEVTLEDVDNMDPQAGVLKKEKVSSSSSIFADRAINTQPDGLKGHWVKTDADCKYKWNITRRGKLGGSDGLGKRSGNVIYVVVERAWVDPKHFIYKIVNVL